MAVRRNITAIRGTDHSAVQRVFANQLGEKFSDMKLEQNAGWLSFMTSPWGVGGSELVKGLVELNLPALQFTTEDACRWRLTICQPGKTPQTIIHEFGNHGEQIDEEDWNYNEDEDDWVDPELAFLMDEPGEKPAPKTPFENFAEDYAELGAPLPQQLIEQLRDLDFNQAVEQFRTWQEELILDFLKSNDVTFDEKYVKNILNWHELTDSELDSDIGNLPRLLSAIGLGKQWDDYVKEAEETSHRLDEAEDDYDDDDEPTSPPVEWIKMAETNLDGIRPLPIDDGPVKLPLEQFHLVRFFPETCQMSEEVTALLTVEYVDADALLALQHLSPPKYQQGENQFGRIEFQPTDSGFKMGFENHLLVERRHVADQLGPDYSQLLKNLPDGTTLTCAFAAKLEPATHQWYQGSVERGQWNITATYPAIARPILKDALKLAKQSSKTKHETLNEQEADQVMEAVKKDSYLHGMDVKRDGLEISCEYDVEFIAKILMRIRFSEYWDFEAVNGHIEKEYLERLETQGKMRRAAAKQAQETKAIRKGKPFFRGEASIYWMSDLAHFSDLEPEILDTYQTAMKELGFELLGDFTTKRFRDYALRCYISPDQQSYSCLTASCFGYLCIDFFSRLSDGSNLTTTTSPMVESRPAVKLYYMDFPDMSTTELYEQHKVLLGRFETKKHALPEQLDPSIEGLAKCLDNSLTRTDEDMRNNGELAFDLF